MVHILPHGNVTSGRPGVGIIGQAETAAGAGIVELREGGNLFVHYCRPAGIPAAGSWIGIFPVGTAPEQITQGNAKVNGYWLRTPGTGPGAACGDALAYGA